MGSDSKVPDQGQSQGWWSTLPGMLTGFAAAITAVTGLIVALHQAGIVKRPLKQSSAAQGESASALSASNQGKIGSGGGVVVGAVSFPSGDEIVIGEGKERVLFKVLYGALEARNNNALALTLRIRVTNYANHPVFCGQSVRLLVNKVPRSPTDTTHLDTPLDGKSARDADAAFELPHGTHRITLLVVDPRNSSGDSYKLALDLSPPKS